MVPKTCSFPECGKPYRAKGLCTGHYGQAYKGKALAPLQPPYGSLPISERFWSEVDKTATCWNWTASKTHNGYGQIFVGRNSFRAHRFSYEMANGSIPQGMQVDHKCHNRACVKPAHLRLATPKENQENHSGPQRNNTSGVRGVSWHKVSGKWKASVKHHGRTHTVGYFNSIDDAERAVVAKRLQLHTRNDKDRAP